MKLVLTVTKGLLEETKYCGKYLSFLICETCPFAIIYKQLFPECIVSDRSVYKSLDTKVIPEKLFSLTKEQQFFIKLFDSTSSKRRPNIHPQSFEVEIPDEVILNYYPTLKDFRHKVEQSRYIHFA